MNKEELGKKLRQIRREKGYTQHELAQKAAISEAYLGEIERGLKMPSMNTFLKVTEALEVSTDSVLCEKPSSGGEEYNKIVEKLKELTPQQRKTFANLLEAYVKSLR